MLMPATVLLSCVGVGPCCLGRKCNILTPSVGCRTSGYLSHGTGHPPAPIFHLNEILSHNLKPIDTFAAVSISLQFAAISHHLIIIYASSFSFPTKCLPTNKG